jgi:hypothetical protein
VADAEARRRVALLSSFSENEWKRTFRHPEHGSIRLDANLALYAWHCLHHAAHIQSLRDRMGWK